MSEVGELLAEYARSGSETAFHEVVTRYLNLVHSTAVRLMNGDSHLAQDVTQKVFADLAKMAGGLSKDVMIGGWLHRHTCFIASKTMRTERRRQAREQEAMLMNELDQPSETHLAALTPVLDEAINQLGGPDRQAIVLRYFEQRDFRSVGDALGSNEEAARKRVNRALDKLRSILKRRGVTLSTTALGAALATHAVSAAPATLAIAITGSALATAASGGGTALTLLHIMSITKFQVGVIAVITIALSAPLVVQHRRATQLQEENQALRTELEHTEALTSENQRLSNLLAKAQAPSAPVNKDQAREVLKLRGEVGALRRTADDAVAAATKSTESPLTGITANPEMQQMLRDQQKLGLGMIYKGFGDRAKLAPEKLDQLNNLLADHVMTNINHITAVLREGKSPQEMDRVFAQQEAETNEQVKNLLGPQDYAKYQEYNRDLASYLTAEQFKAMLPGDKETKNAQAKQLHDLMREETDKALAARGLAPDYQTVPTLNFRNIASEEEGEKNIQLLDSIYAQVQAGAEAFLSPEGLEKFAEFRKLAVNNNRLALSVNRKLMAPPSK
jgi:RNA polymerase sigma factor (sigma-70 family)